MNTKPLHARAAYAAALAAILVLTACSKSGDTAPAAGTAPGSAASTKVEPPRPVRTIRIAADALDDALILPAEVRPRHEQRLGFRVGGKIAQRLVEVGQTVKAGQTLAVMDSADVLPAIAAQRSQVEAARTDEALQQAELKRVGELRDKGFVSGAAYERQDALTQAAAARHAAARSQLSQVGNGLTFQTLRADRPGVVVGIDAEVGSVVAAGQSVVRIAQVGEKELLIAVPERSVQALKTAKRIVAIADAVPGRTYGASLRELAPSADAASRTYAARLSIRDADAALAWGMSSTVRIALTDQPAIVVPNSALYTRDATPRVWVVDAATQTVRPVDVTLGASRDEGVVVTQGLQRGDIVVTAGANLLQPGQKVRLVETVSGPPPDRSQRGPAPSGGSERSELGGSGPPPGRSQGGPAPSGGSERSELGGSDPRESARAGAGKS
jgi:multidrug efflux system membrane fusion protein